MADDLHAAIRAAVETRLALARAAAPYASGEWFMGERWNVYRAESYFDDDGTEHNDLVVYGNVKSQSEHIAANDPATVIRGCERDLRVLERHWPTGKWLWVCSCGDADCYELRDLAAAYSIEVADER